MTWKGRTTKTWMIGIAILAIVMGFDLPFFRVINEDDQHKHVYLIMTKKDNHVFFAVPDELSPTWPRYWRCLLGRPWRGQSFCERKTDRLGEVCELAHPELRMPPGPASTGIRPTVELQVEFERLWALEPSARPLAMGRSPLHQMDRSPLQ